MHLEDQLKFLDKTITNISLNSSTQHQKQSIHNGELISMTSYKQQRQQKVEYKTLGQEIEETLQFIKARPENVLGYLKTAKLYSCQGKQYIALSVLDNGINAVPSSSTDQQLLLRELRDIIQSRIDRRIDYMTQCPYEIVCNIANQVNIMCCLGDKLEFINVSRTWRRKLMGYGPLWKNISISDNKLWKISHKLPVLSFVAKFTDKLLVSGGPTTSIKMLTTYPFSNLKKLEIHIERLSPREATSLLESAFPCVAGTLTGLDIYAPTSTCIALYQILFVLPKLRSINIQVCALNDGERWAQNSTRHFHYNQPKYLSQALIPESTALLTRLEIGTSVYVPMIILHPFLRASTNLRYLALECFRRDVDILAIIDANCPNLADIRLRVKKRQIATRRDEIDEDDGTIPKRFESDPTTACHVVPKGGLRSLELVGVQNTLPLTFRLEKSKNTLRSMSLMMSESSIYSRQIHWQTLSSFTLKSMAYLHICDGRTSFYQHLPEILRHCPALEMLRLQNTPQQLDDTYRLDDVIWSEMAFALTELPKLKTIELDNIESQSKNGFTQFLETIQQGTYMYNRREIQDHQQERYNDQNNGSSATRNDIYNDGLKCLRLINCQYLTMPMLRIVARIQSLRKLIVACVLKDFEVREFLLLVNYGLPRLHHLEFGRVPITEEIAHAIINAWKNNFRRVQFIIVKVNGDNS
ncbi:hypothetical protein INT45_012271 [Circinella minor]|uniref:Uncharacterized protein n=1 Tax=Circinella minor TaxID=1195481 RepID=A0A8H7VLE1_9FUNG|nr:hypothetical protein INT45_012271 [Circinella minor]